MKLKPLGEFQMPCCRWHLTILAYQAAIPQSPLYLLYQSILFRPQQRYTAHRFYDHYYGGLHFVRMCRATSPSRCTFGGDGGYCPRVLYTYPKLQRSQTYLYHTNDLLSRAI
jgi:hypothetical protein